MTLTRWLALFIWLLGTLLAIAVLGENLYFGLGIAVLSGILFGLINLRGYRHSNTRTKNE